MSNDFDWKLVQKGIDLTYNKAYSKEICNKFHHVRHLLEC
jgi:hypothetical protein